MFAEICQNTKDAFFPQKNLSHKNEKKDNQIDDDENINPTILIIVLVNFESRLDYFIKNEFITY